MVGDEVMCGAGVEEGDQCSGADHHQQAHGLARAGLDAGEGVQGNLWLNIGSREIFLVVVVAEV